MANYGAGHFAARKKRRLAEQETQWRVVMGLEDFTVRGKDETAATYQARLFLENDKGYRRQDFADVDMELTRVSKFDNLRPDEPFSEAIEGRELFWAKNTRKPPNPL